MLGVTPSMGREQRSAPRRQTDLTLFAVAAAATAALDRLSQGIALIDGACRVSYANTLAQAICSDTDGLSIHAGELIGTARSDSTRLNAALKRAVGAGAQSSSLRLERPSRKRPLTLLIAPMELETNSIRVPAALVLINDPDRRAAPPKERLIDAYGLTAAEARVAQLLLRGEGIAGVAAHSGISLETARTHLRRVLVKTGTHRQSDLISLLLREVGGLV
jgi:DNA-binding CsgD family transcriptional regulator